MLHMDCISFLLLLPARRDKFGVISLKFMYFSKKSSVFSRAWISQTKNLLMMTKKFRSTKIVNFLIPGQGSCTRVWSYKPFSENALFL